MIAKSYQKLLNTRIRYKSRVKTTYVNGMFDLSIGSNAFQGITRYYLSSHWVQEKLYSQYTLSRTIILKVISLFVPLQFPCRPPLIHIFAIILLFSWFAHCSFIFTHYFLRYQQRTKPHILNEQKKDNRENRLSITILSTYIFSRKYQWLSKIV